MLLVTWGGGIKALEYCRLLLPSVNYFCAAQKLSAVEWGPKLL